MVTKQSHTTVSIQGQKDAICSIQLPLPRCPWCLELRKIKNKLLWNYKICGILFVVNKNTRTVHKIGRPVPESIQWFIEGQAFLVVVRLGSYPTPPTSPVPSANCLSFSLCVDSRPYWREIGGGSERGAKLYDREKAWPSINHFNTLCTVPLILARKLNPGKLGLGLQFFVLI